MSNPFSVKVQVYSPKWGHEDTYEIVFEGQRMQFRGIMKQAECLWVENDNPTWSGHGDTRGNPVENILENDKVYPPSGFVRALEYAWMEWRNGGLNDEQAQLELQELFDWLNTASQSQPSTDFWRRML